MRRHDLALRLAVCMALLAACDGGGGGSDEGARHTLTATVSGGGNGTVTSTPAGIDCGADCTEAFAEGTPVTLHPSADAGSTFLGWTGGGCAGTGDCVIDVVADTTIEAAFALDFSCTLVTNVAYCTQGAIAEINLGPITSAACRSQCEIALPGAGVTSGCWVLASDTNCYCRSGVLATGGTRPGGTCTGP